MQEGLWLFCALAMLAGVGTAALAQGPVGRFEVFELSLSSDQAYDNPFTETTVAAKFTSPVGKVVPLEGFYFGGTEWRVRFVPDAVGTWKYEVTLTGKGEPVTKTGVFECVKSERHGFIRISKKNPYRFEHDDGTPFYPIGQQTGWGVRPTMAMDGPEEGQGEPVSLEMFMQAFTGATNLMRCQLGTGTTAGVALDMLEPNSTSRMNLESCLKFDLSSQTLKRYGWSQITIPFQDMSLWKGKPHAFGPTEDSEGVWKSLKSPLLPDVERYLRYIVARYGAYTDVWEIFNEDSYAPNDWLAHLAKVIRDADPYDHPITTNYERPFEPWCEIVCPHQYTAIPAREVGYFLSKEYARLKSFGKPVQFTEFGNKSALSNYDPVKWRQAAWVSFMNECGMLFWNMSRRRTIADPTSTGNSNAYLGSDTRQALRVLARFTQDLPLTMRPAWIGFGARSPVQAWALADGQACVVYFNQAATHETELDPEHQPLWIGPGKYHVKWIDPADGKVRAQEQVQTNQFVLWLKSPSFKVDIAARLDRLGPPEAEVRETLEMKE